MTTRFTGWHMTAILVAFFALVVAVNVTMARYASSTFGGALAENGYVASQDYNRWIAKARDQDRLGWTATAGVEQGHLAIRTDGVRDAIVTVRLVHPLGRVAATDLAMHASDPGRSVSVAPMPHGRWLAYVNVTKGGRSARYILEVSQ